MDDQQKTSTIAILTAAIHNANVVRDQVHSLNDDYPMPNVVQQMDEAVEAIKKELDVLNA